MTPSGETSGAEHNLDALALIRASITGDGEAARVILTYADHDGVMRWLVTYARAWLLDLCGLRDDTADRAVTRALDHLDQLTAIAADLDRELAALAAER